MIDFPTSTFINLQSYCLVSTATFVGFILHSLNSSTKSTDEVDPATDEASSADVLLEFFSNDPYCFWVGINQLFCLVLLAVKGIVGAVFGKLRPPESQQLREKFRNYVFYKFIFVFGILNLEALRHIALWVTWLAVIGFLHLLIQLCSLRFHYLSLSASVRLWPQIKLLALLNCILCVTMCLTAASIVIGINYSFSNSAFMIADCLLVGIKTIFAVFRISIYLWEAQQEASLERRSPIRYYVELVLELLAHGVDFLNYLHMLVYSRLFFSMACLIILLQLRLLYQQIQRRIQKHRNYMMVLRTLSQQLTTVDVAGEERCAICWQDMGPATRLPCGHLFHSGCVAQWIEQDASCPSCRKTLSPLRPQTAAPRQETVLLFRWLPTISFRFRVPQDQQLQSMVQAVSEVFPQRSEMEIREAILAAGSVEAAIEQLMDTNSQGPESEDELLEDIQPPEEEVRIDDTPPISELSLTSEPPAAVESSEGMTIFKQRKQRLLDEARVKFLRKQRSKDDDE